MTTENKRQFFAEVKHYHMVFSKNNLATKCNRAFAEYLLKFDQFQESYFMKLDIFIGLFSKIISLIFIAPILRKT